MKIYSIRDIRPSDFEDFDNITGLIQEALNAGLHFMKLSTRSPKAGEFGIRPITTILEALESIGSLKPVEREESLDQEYIIFCHWRPIDREYRVFIRDRCIEAISQQHCYDVLPTYNTHALTDARLIEDWVSKQRIWPYEESTLDIAITGDVAWPIEWNPPTLWCSGGSSLLTEEDIIELRDIRWHMPTPVYITTDSPHHVIKN